MDPSIPISDQLPVVDYLVLGERPHLCAQECRACGARFFGRRNGCASCFSTEFQSVEIPTVGTLRTFTIVAHAAQGVPVPFVSGIVDCGGTSVRTNIVNVDPDSQHVRTGMRVRFTTQSLGRDSTDREAIGFGYEPVAETGDEAP
jgi:uncharacterized protein